MGAGASLGDGVKLTSEEVEDIYNGAVGVVKDKVGDKLSEEAAFIQVVESKFNIPDGKFLEFLGSATAAPKSPRADVEPPEAPTIALVEARLTEAELKVALSRSGLSFVGGEPNISTEEGLNSQIGSLFAEIEAILGKKKPKIIEKDAEESKNIDWKALNMLGDEKLIQKEKEKPKIDAAHSGSGHGNKALEKLGTIKAVENKKIRSRLGSDMSMDQVKQQQVAEAREKAKFSKRNLLSKVVGE
mmetsp:Transcript_19948/g.41686  ORF Transcript_19948/g.41686 Transcript_19948/m.41686 type:complete len:244 (-) Transcript_19948:51-782(-)|eukprot:CAMPEP_0118651166 /NCGR_PEP_ID=MMETSP0785-20121206/10642_1 /TAXON_ID=91992 /ORGANISM="Bolidomonas pacifica, Strain CCMP 1866" /LENGTH=243 /DNA_ID=CAMNT_0006543603 /DNA_START=170 /DNA_END=901 /DNA_ORIENTATION=+